ncbi:MAG: hypothetical protein NZM40_01045 [Sphingomonadaceae bacterium]|uniref:DUF6671 family protein n=1 Tax=Thermaurantiacus sp. TaxID=2820283 RepID=UPI00298EEE86|nr:DUF6671 family protein [Thermaurantiacus sp.]MCS6986028.1 hypothetical protein [Sphingomonadaceae bacterium]MDW8414756.1 hypothetical protein [Thermaurantiacus sp.]
MHAKERAIAPALARIGIEVVVPCGFDTDRFGTFTGDIPRAGTMVEAARAKAREAARALKLPVGVASEGAYGPHPAIPWVPLGRELLLWHEVETGRDVVEMTVDEEPAWASAEVSHAIEVEALLQSVGFPATAVVVAPADAPARPVAKGVTDRACLADAIAAAVGRSSVGRALVAADMRAHLNPRRMQVIARLAADFARRLATPCPACSAPGFGMVEALAGLPCAACGTPTALMRAARHACTACGHSEERPRAEGPRAADPAHCPLCNP